MVQPTLQIKKTPVIYKRQVFFLSAFPKLFGEQNNGSIAPSL
jgi:hypothetical protein